MVKRGEKGHWEEQMVGGEYIDDWREWEDGSGGG